MILDTHFSPFAKAKVLTNHPKEETMKTIKKGRAGPKQVKNPVVLIVLDGWGVDQKGNSNAISLAGKPEFDSLEKEFGEIRICASGV